MLGSPPAQNRRRQAQSTKNRAASSMLSRRASMRWQPSPRALQQEPFSRFTPLAARAIGAEDGFSACVIGTQVRLLTPLLAGKMGTAGFPVYQRADAQRVGTGKSRRSQ